MTALTADELIAWLEHTSAGWRALMEAHPEALGIACDIRETHTVAELLQHIVAVEMRFAERIAGQPETGYEQIPFDSVAAIFAVHDRAMALLPEYLQRGPEFWEEVLDYQTRKAGVVRVSRRTMLVHLAMHSIRHYAQLATLLRQNGIAPEWSMDYLFMGAKARA